MQTELYTGGYRYADRDIEWDSFLLNMENVQKKKFF